ncbi:hypothetical protein MMC18_007254 [Xylographa bjoerkii]|nr:hypothetical protein [Xylographa bjoerkii]
MHAIRLVALCMTVSFVSARPTAELDWKRYFVRTPTPAERPSLVGPEPQISSSGPSTGDCVSASTCNGPMGSGNSANFYAGESIPAWSDAIADWTPYVCSQFASAVTTWLNAPSGNTRLTQILQGTGQVLSSSFPTTISNYYINARFEGR